MNEDKPKPTSDIWVELDKLNVEYQIPSDAISVPMVQERYKVSYTIAKSMIDRMLEDGKIEFIDRFRHKKDGRKCRYYRMVKSEDKEDGK